MTKLDRYLNDYRLYHRTRGNNITHAFGVPVIVLCILGMLDRVHLMPSPFLESFGYHFSLGFLVWLGAGLFYCTLRLSLGISMLATTAVLYRIGVMLPMPMLWGLFVSGWIVQLIGHYLYEGKSPAFFKNFTFLLIGPVYIHLAFLKRLSGVWRG